MLALNQIFLGAPFLASATHHINILHYAYRYLLAYKHDKMCAIFGMKQV